MSALPDAGAEGFQQVALLIDADNFHDAKSIDAAWAQLKARAGRVSVCRAYGNVVRLQTLAPLWRTLGARIFPNLSLEKNTTDAALIADAVALHFQQGVRFFAIASGDADFAPLAVRLREWGCQVWCFSMEGIVFQGVEAYYDRVVRFRPAPPVAPVTAVAKPAAPRAPEETPTIPVFNVVPRAEKSLTSPLQSPEPAFRPAPKLELQPESRPAPKPEPNPLPKPAPNPDLLLPDVVLLILKALPGLREKPQHLSQAAATLRQQGILGKTVKSTQFLAPYAAYFKLSPPHQPNRLEFLVPHAFQRVASMPGKKPVVQPVKPLQKAPERSVILAAQPVVLSWPTTISRQATPRLLTELHGLRFVLLQLAVRRVSVADVLLAIPEMLTGHPCALSAVAGRLREKGLLQPYQSALHVLERHETAFAVEMNCAPQAVIYLR